MKKCNIQNVGKRRDGNYRYWCMEHKADATGKYGVELSKCRRADIEPLTSDEIYLLDLNEFKGGIALWGAVPPVYDTSPCPIDRGIHLHARHEVGGVKVIDKTFRKIDIQDNDQRLSITEEDAVYYMTSLVMGHDLRDIKCNHCGYTHLDKDVLAVNIHRKHLCSGCGREFYDSGAYIGNPLVEIKEKLNDPEIHRNVKISKLKLNIQQKDYPGGIQIWGSNQAILWQSEVLEEEGIHVHCISEDKQKLLDDTYSEVIIDGIVLEPQMVRFFMAQSALPHLRDSLFSLVCPSCKEPHFDKGDFAYKPHVKHKCEKCKTIFESPYRKKKTISNPVIELLEELEKNAVRVRKTPYLDLLTEGRAKN